MSFSKAANLQKHCRHSTASWISDGDLLHPPCHKATCNPVIFKRQPVEVGAVVRAYAHRINAEEFFMACQWGNEYFFWINTDDYTKPCWPGTQIVYLWDQGEISLLRPFFPKASFFSTKNIVWDDTFTFKFEFAEHALGVELHFEMLHAQWSILEPSHAGFLKQSLKMVELIEKRFASELSPVIDEMTEVTAKKTINVSKFNQLFQAQHQCNPDFYYQRHAVGWQAMLDFRGMKFSGLGMNKKEAVRNLLVNSWNDIVEDPGWPDSMYGLEIQDPESPILN